MSPSGNQIAVAVGDDGERMLVVDKATGRVVHRYDDMGDTSGLGGAVGGLYWLGGNDAHPSILGVGLTCGPLACVTVLTVLGKGISLWDDPYDGDHATGLALSEGAVLS
jgi:hypothetical protein